MNPEPDELGPDPRSAYLRAFQLRNRAALPRPTAEECLAYSLGVGRRARHALGWNRLFRDFLRHETAR